MDKIKGIPKGLPTIGEKQIPVQEIVNQIAAQLKPTMDIILNNIETLEKRLEIAEEVRKIFPDKVEVTVKHEYPKISVPEIINAEEELDKEMLKRYKSITDKKKKEKKCTR